MSSGRFLDKSLKFDWVFMLTTFALMACGIVLVYSATASEDVVFYESFWFKQIIYFVGGCLLATGIVFLKIDWLKRLTVPLYAASD